MAGLFDELEIETPAPKPELSPALKRVNQLRTSLLILRFCYYCLEESLVPDHVYDMRERELKQMLEADPALDAAGKYSDICPTKTVGSSDMYDYPDVIEWLARKMVEEHHARTSHI